MTRAGAADSLRLSAIRSSATPWRASCAAAAAAASAPHCPDRTASSPGAGPRHRSFLRGDRRQHSGAPVRRLGRRLAVGDLLLRELTAGYDLPQEPFFAKPPHDPAHRPVGAADDGRDLLLREPRQGPTTSVGGGGEQLRHRRPPFPLGAVLERGGLPTSRPGLSIYPLLDRVEPHVRRVRRTSSSGGTRQSTSPAASSGREPRCAAPAPSAPRTRPGSGRSDAARRTFPRPRGAPRRPDRTPIAAQLLSRRRWPPTRRQHRGRERRRPDDLRPDANRGHTPQGKGSPAAPGCPTAPPLVIAATRRGGSMPRTAHGRRARGRRAGARVDRGHVSTRARDFPAATRVRSGRPSGWFLGGRRGSHPDSDTRAVGCGGGASAWENGKDSCRTRARSSPRGTVGTRNGPLLVGGEMAPAANRGDVRGWGPTDGVWTRRPFRGSPRRLATSQRQSLLVADLDVTGHRLADQVGHRHPVLRRVSTGRVEYGGRETDQQRAGVSGLGA